MPDERKDRIAIEGGITHLPAEFREVARLANQAGLEGYEFVDAEYIADFSKLQPVAGGLIGDFPEFPVGLEITYRRAADEMVAEQEGRAKLEEEIRHACATMASNEYEYWKNLPKPEDPIVEAMHMSAMGAAANICAAIFLNRPKLCGPDRTLDKPEDSAARRQGDT